MGYEKKSIWSLMLFRRSRRGAVVWRRSLPPCRRLLVVGGRGSVARLWRLHPLLLLCVPLLHLLCLLLVFLLHLLLSRLIRALLLQTLVLLILPLLKLLMFLLLLVVYLLLLLLHSLVLLRIARVRRSWALVRRDVVRVYRIWRPGHIVLRLGSIIFRAIFRARHIVLWTARWWIGTRSRLGSCSASIGVRRRRTRGSCFRCIRICASRTTIRRRIVRRASLTCWNCRLESCWP